MCPTRIVMSRTIVASLECPPVLDADGTVVESELIVNLDESGRAFAVRFIDRHASAADAVLITLGEPEGFEHNQIVVVTEKLRARDTWTTWGPEAPISFEPTPQDEAHVERAFALIRPWDEPISWLDAGDSVRADLQPIVTVAGMKTDDSTSS